MDDDYDYEKLKKAGTVTQEAIEYAKTVVKEGASLLDAASKVEEFIKSKGCKPSFPVNVSRNAEAAHYTPEANEEKVFGKDLVKMDIGARVDEYLGDGAVTIDLSGQNGKMVECSEKALDAALATVKAGRQVREIGREIERVVTQYGFKPIRNLGGHWIEREELHAGIFIPNYDDGNDAVLEEGAVIAIEPFVTAGDAEGYVVDGEAVQIFQKIGSSGIRTAETREISDFIDASYMTYPFAMRWLSAKFGEFRVRRALQEMMAAGILETFPVLVEKSGKAVAQAEKELIVEKGSCTIVTK